MTGLGEDRLKGITGGMSGGMRGDVLTCREYLYIFSKCFANSNRLGNTSQIRLLYLSGLNMMASILNN